MANFERMSRRGGIAEAEPEDCALPWSERCELERATARYLALARRQVLIWRMEQELLRRGEKAK